MLQYQSDTYRYHRTKDVFCEDGLNTIFVFACLNINREQYLGDFKREQMIPGPSVLIETDINEAPQVLKNLPNEDVFFTLTKAEYELLEETSEKDEVAFLLYKHVISD